MTDDHEGHDHADHDHAGHEHSDHAGHDHEGHDEHAHHDHDAHGGEDDHASVGHHAPDPNAGVVVGTPPTPAWVGAAALIALVTIVATVILAITLNDKVPDELPPATTEQGHQD